MKPQATSPKKGNKKWSKHVAETSDALDLEEGIFTSTDAKEIAASLKASTEKSDRKKSSPFQSAMSMLNFYENRVGSNLPPDRKKSWKRQKTS